MKALLLAFVTSGALSVGLLPTNASAQQLHLGVNMGNGYGHGYDNGYGHGQWNHRRHHHNHCHMMKVWHHHHPVWIQQCGW